MRNDAASRFARRDLGLRKVSAVTGGTALAGFLLSAVLGGLLVRSASAATSTQPPPPVGPGANDDAPAPAPARQVAPPTGTDQLQPPPQPPRTTSGGHTRHATSGGS